MCVCVRVCVCARTCVRALQNPNIKISENDINKTIKEFFKEVKKYNVDTNFSAKNSAEVGANVLRLQYTPAHQAYSGPTEQHKCDY